MIFNLGEYWKLEMDQKIIKWSIYSGGWNRRVYYQILINIEVLEWVDIFHPATAIYVQNYHLHKLLTVIQFTQKPSSD